MVRELVCGLALLCLGVSAQQAAAQGQVAGAATGSVRGQVICADTQQPARLAHVVLQPLVDLKSPVAGGKSEGYHPEGVFHLQTVGLDGSFAIANVPQGLYYVIVEQDGYVSPLSLFTRDDLNKPDEATLRRIGRYMTPISVTAGHTTQAQMTLVRGAVIEGAVRFEDGSPAVGVDVVLLQHDAKGIWERFRTNRLAGRSSDHTDDRGVYRFTGLPGGEYLVRASIELNNVITDHVFGSGGGTSYGDGYRLEIFPGDAFRTRDAKPVKVEEGENASGVDVDVPLSKLYSVAGTVLRPDSAGPVNAAHVTLNFMDTGDEIASTDVDTNDGTFHFVFVPGGSYTLSVTNIANVQRTEVSNGEHVIPPTHTETKVIASFGDVSQPLELTGDQSGVVMHAKAGATR